MRWSALLSEQISVGYSFTATYLLKWLVSELCALNLLVHVGCIGHVVLAVMEVHGVLHTSTPFLPCTFKRRPVYVQNV